MERRKKKRDMGGRKNGSTERNKKQDEMQGSYLILGSLHHLLSRHVYLRCPQSDVLMQQCSSGFWVHPITVQDWMPEQHDNDVGTIGAKIRRQEEFQR